MIYRPDSPSGVIIIFPFFTIADNFSCTPDIDILFIDASNEFEKGKNQNNLTDENVEKIVNTFVNRETIDKYSYVASMDEIKENDYNLNIPRYVDTFEEEEPIDLVAVSERIASIDKEIAKLDEELAVYLRELGL